jgi:hypothetical protein
VAQAGGSGTVIKLAPRSSSKLSYLTWAELVAHTAKVSRQARRRQHLDMEMRQVQAPHSASQGYESTSSAATVKRDYHQKEIHIPSGTLPPANTLAAKASRALQNALSRRLMATPLHQSSIDTPYYSSWQQ